MNYKSEFIIPSAKFNNNSFKSSNIEYWNERLKKIWAYKLSKVFNNSSDDYSFETNSILSL